jgi:hypothetical protein
MSNLRPFMGHSSKCERCERLFVRKAHSQTNTKNAYLCPKCIKEQESIVLPSQGLEFDAIRINPNAWIFSNVKRSDHPGFRSRRWKGKL